MDNPTNTEFAGKIQKLARLAFNPAAADGESANAVQLIVQIARKNGVDFDGFKSFLGVCASVSNSSNTCSPVLCMPFGKYCGRSLEEIFQINPDYLDWFVNNVTGNAVLKRRITAFLQTKQQNY